MKVILNEDIRSLGKKGDIVEVSDGYARNYLLKKKKGVEANARTLNDLKLKKAKEEKDAQENYEAAQELAKKLENEKIVIPIKTGEGGRAFGSVSSKEIASAVEDQLHLTVDKKKIQLQEPIKELGTREVSIRLHPKVTATLTLEVTQEQ